MPARRDRQAEIAVIRPAQPRTTHHAVAGATERRLTGAMEVPIDQVVPDLGQPRQDWAHHDGERRLIELADSIREFGILQPLVVREEGTIDDGRQRYVIIAGARRRAAAEHAGLTSVPVIVRGEEATRVRILQLVENLQRQNLSPIDEARAYQEIIDIEGLTPPALATRLHISAQQVRDRLRVLADQVLADAVERRQISATAARDIRQLPDDEMMRFRTRILAGERLQTNDVAVVRARLAAEGIINPRRKFAREKQTSFVPDESQTRHVKQEVMSAEPAAGAAEAPSRPVDEQAGEKKQTPFVPPSPLPVAPPSANGVQDVSVSAATSLPTVTELSPQRHEQAIRMATELAAALDGKRREMIAALLDGDAGDPRVQEWWLQVYRHLQQQLR